jgi:hypothetical protein
MDFSQQTRRRRNSSHRLTQIFADKCRRMFLLHLRSPALLCSSFSFSLRVVMRRKECRRSPNTAISAEKCSIPNLQQGACLAQEVGGVGGETSGTARVRAGFAPNKSFSPAQRSCISERGCGGSSPCVCAFFSRSQTGKQITWPISPDKIIAFIRLSSAAQSRQVHLWLAFFSAS